MAGIYVNDEGTWKLPKSIWVNDGTSTSGSTGWRVCKNVYVNNGGFWQEMIRSVDLTSSKNNFNLYEYVGSPTEPLSLIFNIDSTVEIGSDGPTLPQWCPFYCSTTRTNLPKRPTAFTVGNFPAGSTVIINNNGYISGGGGYGGAGGASFAQGPGARVDNGFSGGEGGDAITKGSTNSFDCTLVNTGTIAAGGGGGGGAGGKYVGGGVSTGGAEPGGNGGDGAGITGFSRTAGGPSSANTDQNISTTNGGNGGNLGASGATGITGTFPSYYGGAGGQPGKAVNASGIEVAVYGNIIGVVS